MPDDFARSRRSKPGQSATSASRSPADSLAEQDIPFSVTIGALCKAKKDGKTKHVGVSNFTTAMLDEAWAVTTEPLVCNQIEVHPFINQDKVIAASKKHGMAVVAYVPIARGKVPGAEALERIGKAHGKSAAQVSLRYLVAARPHPDSALDQARASEGQSRRVRFQTCPPRRWPSSRSSTPPICAWSIRRTRRCGTRLDQADGRSQRLQYSDRRSRHLGAARARLRAADRAGDPHRLPPHRHRADVRQRGAKWARACAPPASATR